MLSSHSKSGYDNHPELLKQAQKKPLIIWNISVCPKCKTKYDLILVRYSDGNPVCPNCGFHGSNYYD